MQERLATKMNEKKYGVVDSIETLEEKIASIRKAQAEENLKK